MDPPDVKPDPEVLPDAPSITESRKPIVPRKYVYNGKVYDGLGAAYSQMNEDCKRLRGDEEEDKRKPEPEPDSKSSEEPPPIDPEDYADNAFLVCVAENDADNIAISMRDSVWATIKRNVPKAKKMWDDWIQNRARQPLLIVSSYQPAGNKLVHGAMLMTSAPRELIDKDKATPEQVNDPWIVKDKWEGKFDVEWVIWCPDKNNIMAGSYYLSEKRDFCEIEKGLAHETIQGLKEHAGVANKEYLTRNAGKAVLERFNKMVAEDNSTEPPHVKRTRTTEPVKIEYETEAPKAGPAPDLVLNPMADLEKIFLAPKPSKDYWDPNISDLSFEVIDQDYCDMPTMDSASNPMIEIEQFHSPIAPVLRLYGCTKEGHSVVAMIRGFMPYFFVRAPSSIVDLLPYRKHDREINAQLDKEAKQFMGKEEHYSADTLLGQVASSMEAKGCCEWFASNLSKQLIASWDWHQKKRFGYAQKYHRNEGGEEEESDEEIPSHQPVLKVVLVRRQTIMGYHPYLDWFLKVVMVSPHFVKPSRDILEGGSFLWYVGERGVPVPGVMPEKYQVFEANIPFALRYMIDVEQMGPCWVTLPKDKYYRWDCKEKEKATYADIEVMTTADEVVVHSSSEAEWAGHAPVRSITFDCEMDGLNGRFPRPDFAAGDPVICISVRVSNEVSDQSKQLVGDVLFSWGLTADIGMSNMMCYYGRVNADKESVLEINAELGSEEMRYKRCGVSRIRKGEYAYWTPYDEASMLRQFRDFIIHIARPFVITGYNVNNFDLPYLFKRAAHLGMGSEFDCMGWIKGQRTKVRQKIFSSKAFGSRVNHELNMPGRLVVDALHLIQRNHKQRSYSLNGSLANHLGYDEQGNPKYVKADVPHEMIGFLWNHSPDSRARVAYYCHYDVVLSRMLYDKLYLYLDNAELAGAAGVPTKYVIDRGLQIRVLSLLLRKAKCYLLVAPVASDDKKNVDEDKYKGATVIEPIPGFYEDPVYTLDFTSLYPTIMIAFNLCYCTMMKEDATPDEMLALDQLFRIATDQGLAQFAKQGTRIGVFPMVLESLLAARNKAKAEVKRYASLKQFGMAKTLDLRQNSLKLNANACYGMAGAGKGMLPCRMISAAVTRIGREGIDTVAQVSTRPYLPFPRSFAEFSFQYHTRVKTPDWPFVAQSKEPAEIARLATSAEVARMDYLKNRAVESDAQYAKRCEDARADFPIPRLPDETIEEHKKRILETIDFIYGDTDSIMVVCKKCKTAEEAIKLGQAFAVWVTKYFFHSPMAILFEKIYWPFILFAKKRYAGMKWLNLVDPPKRETKGLETVRRDNAPIVATTVDNVIASLLKHKSIEKAALIVKNVNQSILDGSVNISSLIISKSLSKQPKDYDQKAPHVELALKMMRRDLNTAPRMGDRVPYVMIARGGRSKDIKACEKAEDPLYVIERDLQIDRTYYLEQQLYNPIERILDPLVPGITSRLFSMSPCTIYLPPNMSVLAKKLLDARTSTGGDEGILASALSGPTGPVSDAGNGGSVPPPAPPPPPKAGAAAKGTKRKDDKPKVVHGQRSIAAMFKNDNSEPDLIKPLDPTAPLKSWIKAAPKKPRAQVAGQISVDGCLQRITSDASTSSVSVDSETQKPALPPMARNFIRAPERDITIPKEGYIPLDIRYKIVVASPVKAKESMGQYGRIRPKCITCGVIITASVLTKEDLAKGGVVAPVCKYCREKWKMQGRNTDTEIEELTKNYKAMSLKADEEYKERWKICCDCQKVKTIEDVPDCSARECNNFYPRTGAKTRRTKFDNTLRRLEAHKPPVCASMTT